MPEPSLLPAASAALKALVSLALFMFMVVFFHGTSIVRNWAFSTLVMPQWRGSAISHLRVVPKWLSCALVIRPCWQKRLVKSDIARAVKLLDNWVQAGQPLDSKP